MNETHLFVQKRPSKPWPVVHSRYCRCYRRSPRMPPRCNVDYYFLTLPADSNVAEAEVFLSNKTGRLKYWERSNLRVIDLPPEAIQIVNGSPSRFLIKKFEEPKEPLVITKEMMEQWAYAALDRRIEYVEIDPRTQRMTTREL